MPPLPSTRVPPIGTGMASLVLGVIGLMFSPIPVLSVPVSVLSLILGLIGTVVGLIVGGVRLRWGLLGVAVSGLALGLTVAQQFAVLGYIPERQVPKLWQLPPDRPWVPPPAPATPVPGASLGPLPHRPT